MDFKMGAATLTWIVLTLLVGNIFADVENELLKLDVRFKEILNSLTKARENRDIENTNRLFEESKKFRRAALKIVFQLRDQHVSNQFLKKQLEMYSHIGFLIIPSDKEYQLRKIISKASRILTPNFHNFRKELFQQDLNSVERDIDIQNKWKSLSENSSNAFIEGLNSYVELIVDTSKQLGFSTPWSFWTYVFTYDIHFNKDEIMHIWETQVKKPSRMFIWNFIKETFTELVTAESSSLKKNGPIPAYLYDQIYHFYKSAIPHGYQDTPLFNRLQERGVLFSAPNVLEGTNVKILAENVHKFFRSLGFKKLSSQFWEKSSFHYNPNSAIYFQHVYYNKTEYSMLVNAPVNIKSYCQIAEEFLKIYKNLLWDELGLPVILKKPDFDAFHEALSEAIVMSLKSPKRAIKDKLINKADVTDDFNERILNAEAVTIFTSLTSAMVTDTWKWNIMTNNTPGDKIICGLWNQRYKFEGVVPMTIDQPFDAHQIVDVYSSNHIFSKETNYKDFIRIILRYQIFARFCQLAGEFDPKQPLKKPLHKCDLSGSPGVGKLIILVLQYGSSISWRELLNVIYGNEGTFLDAGGLLHYFAPLLTKLPEERRVKFDIPPKDFCLKN